MYRRYTKQGRTHAMRATRRLAVRLMEIRACKYRFGITKSILKLKKKMDEHVNFAYRDCFKSILLTYQIGIRIETYKDGQNLLVRCTWTRDMAMAHCGRKGHNKTRSFTFIRPPRWSILNVQIAFLCLQKLNGSEHT